MSRRPRIDPARAGELAQALFGVAGEARALRAGEGRRFLIGGGEEPCVLEVAAAAAPARWQAAHAALRHIARRDPGGGRAHRLLGIAPAAAGP